MLFPAGALRGGRTLLTYSRRYRACGGALRAGRTADFSGDRRRARRRRSACDSATPTSYTFTTLPSIPSQQRVSSTTVQQSLRQNLLCMPLGARLALCGLCTSSRFNTGVGMLTGYSGDRRWTFSIAGTAPARGTPSLFRAGWTRMVRRLPHATAVALLCLPNHLRRMTARTGRGALQRYNAYSASRRRWLGRRQGAGASLASACTAAGMASARLPTTRAAAGR